MRKSYLHIAATLLIWMVVSTGYAETAGQLVQRKDNGSVNWSAGIVGVAGSGSATGSAIKTRVAAIELARTNATEMARQKLLEILHELRVDTSYRLSDISVAHPQVGDRIQAMVDHLPVIDQLETIRPDGSIAVQLMMSIRGGFAQLVLPQEIRKIESITKVMPAKNISEETPSTSTETSEYTGLIVDARGILVEPALAPKLLNERLEEVYGPEFASREYAIQNGIASYYTDMEKATVSPRVAGNPLVLKAIRTAWPGLCDLVISNGDATELRSSSKHLMFLRECRVIIVTDPL
jgi:hypothetical protein